MSSVLPDVKFNLFWVMSNQNFVLLDQDGVLGPVYMEVGDPR